jgi:pimeloyl-ACP methyl ester carboxylesterase
MLTVLLAASALAATDVTLTAADGTKLHAIAEKSATKTTKGIVLVHMNGRDASDWTYMAEKLAKKDMHAIAVDLRGHGSSAKADDDLTDDDYLAMTKDVEAAAEWLRKQGVTEISCAGGSIGANLCVHLGADNADVVNLVLLSPGLKYQGVTSGDALERYGNRPVLLVAAEEDRYAFKTATILETKAKGQVKFQPLGGDAHGTKMLNRDPALEGTVTSWLLGTYELSAGVVVAPRPASQAQAEDVKTTGEKLDSHK